MHDKDSSITFNFIHLNFLQQLSSPSVHLSRERKNKKYERKNRIKINEFKYIYN